MDIGACDFVIHVSCNGETSHHRIRDLNLKDVCSNHLVYLRQDRSIHAVVDKFDLTQNTKVEEKELIFPVIYWPSIQERIPSGSPLMLQNTENGELTFLGGSFTSRSGFHGNFAFQLVKPQIYNKLVCTAINELKEEIKDLKGKLEKIKKDIEEKESQVQLLKNYTKDCLEPAIRDKKLRLKKKYQSKDSSYTISMSLTICMSETRITHSGSQGATKNGSLKESSPNNGSLEECSQGAPENGSLKESSPNNDSLKESSPNNGSLEECSQGAPENGSLEKCSYS